jgi:hypothetical protein
MSSSIFHAATGFGSEVRSFVELSLDTPLSALPQFVQEATRKLFAAFDGAKIPQATIEDAARRFFEKRR